jgi:hypothetical protein
VSRSGILMPNISEYENGYWDGYHGIIVFVGDCSLEYILGYEDGAGDKDSDFDRHFGMKYTFSYDYAIDLKPFN